MDYLGLEVVEREVMQLDLPDDSEVSWPLEDDSEAEISVPVLHVLLVVGELVLHSAYL